MPLDVFGLFHESSPVCGRNEKGNGLYCQKGVITTYIYYNANPVRKSHGDCVIRALAKVLDMSWEEVAIDLSMMQVKLYDMQNS